MPFHLCFFNTEVISADKNRRSLISREYSETDDQVTSHQLSHVHHAKVSAHQHQGGGHQHNKRASLEADTKQFIYNELHPKPQAEAPVPQATLDKVATPKSILGMQCRIL